MRSRSGVRDIPLLLSALAVTLAMVPWGRVALAQGTDAVPPATRPAQGRPGSSGITPASASGELEDMKKLLRHQQQQIKQLEQNFKTLEQQNQELKRDLQIDQEAEPVVEAEGIEDQTRELRVYGFMDVMLYRYFTPDEKGMVGSFQKDKPLSFALWHLNVYLDKPISQSWRTMAEIRFTMLPGGNDVAFENPFGGEYERVENATYDIYDGRQFHYGSIAIERAWIEYKPLDYFAVRAGRFLTPYGIWNVEHASLIIIPARQPYLLAQEHVPMAQLGLYLHGRALFGDMYLDYGLTVSNGRGPIDQVRDLDDNLGLGLRLRFVWDGPAAKLALGTYLYMGGYSDIKKKIASFEPFYIEQETTVAYDEKLLAADFLLEWSGLRLQSEFVWSTMEYKEGKHEPAMAPNTYKPSRNKYSLYVLTAYRLPFEKVNISPYFMYELNQENEFESWRTGHMFTGGINWRIHPAVAWKVEAFYYMTGEHKGIKDQFWAIGSQLAASF